MADFKALIYNPIQGFEQIQLGDTLSADNLRLRPGATANNDGGLALGTNPGTITTSAGEILIQQTGDRYGASRLRLSHRDNANGATFETGNDGGSVNLVDFRFVCGNAAYGVQRLEARSGSLASNANTQEFQFSLNISPSGGNCSLAIGNNEIRANKVLRSESNYQFLRGSFTTTLSVVTPTANCTINLPDKSGTVRLREDPIPSTRRQTIAQGRLDSSGFPNAITANSGLSVTINAATAPLRANFAAGFDELPIDFSGTFASDQVFSGLTASITHYFYLERNTSTGVVTAARIAIAPVYARIAPTSPATGLHWFKISEDSLTSQPGMTMYEWSGTLWTPRQRVFLGEATTSASAVTSISNYAYNRRYQSDWLTVAANTIVSFSHNLGMTPAEAGATLTFYGRQNSSDLLESFVPSGFNIGSAGYGVLNYGAGGRLNHPFYVGDFGIYYPGVGAWLISADIRCSINSTW